MYSTIKEDDYILLKKELEKINFEFYQYFQTYYDKLHQNWNCSQRESNISLYNTNNVSESIFRSLLRMIKQKRQKLDVFSKDVGYFLDDCALKINDKGLSRTIKHQNCILLTNSF